MEQGAILPLRARMTRVAYYLRLPRVSLGIGLFALLLVPVTLPCLKLLATTLTWDAADIRLSPAARPGAFTLFHWGRVFASGLSDALFYRPLVHSLVTSVSIGILAVCLGAGLAWLTLFRTERLGGAAGLFRFVSEAGLEIQGLSKRFGVVPAVADVSLTVPAASFLTLLGPSGCGKTTLLRMPAGLELPDSGLIRLGGQTVFSDREGRFVSPGDRGAGLVFQSYAL